MSHTTTLLAATVLLTSPAIAQLEPGDVLIRSNPSGNTVAAHRPDGTLIARSDGPLGDWRMGMALTHDGGWVTFRLDIQALPPGWYMLRHDSNGNLIQETYAAELADLGNYPVVTSAEGIILVCDGPRGRVHRYASDGSFLSFVDVGALGMNAHTICATPDGGFWVFDDGWFSSVAAHGVRIDVDGLPVDAVTFQFPAYDIDLAPDGTFWHSTDGSTTVRHYDDGGVFLGSFDFDLGLQSGTFLRTPTGVAVKDDGTLLVAVKYSQQITHLSPTGQVLGSFIAATDIVASEIQIVREPAPPGSLYCTAAPNSSGFVGLVEPQGSLVVSDDDFSLRAGSLPTHAFGYFIGSTQSGFVTNPAGSAGNLCLGGSIGRFNRPGEILSSGAGGEFTLALDLMDMPTPTGSVAVQANETWYFQAWHRDSVQGVTTSNFTRGLSVAFR